MCAWHTLRSSQELWASQHQIITRLLLALLAERRAPDQFPPPQHLGAAGRTRPSQMPAAVPGKMPMAVPRAVRPRAARSDGRRWHQGVPPGRGGWAHSTALSQQSVVPGCARCRLVGDCGRRLGPGRMGGG